MGTFASFFVKEVARRAGGFLQQELDIPLSFGLSPYRGGLFAFSFILWYLLIILCNSPYFSSTNTPSSNLKTWSAYFRILLSCSIKKSRKIWLKMTIIYQNIKGVLLASSHRINQNYLVHNPLMVLTNYLLILLQI